MALLGAMGYGEEGSLERTSATGDAGVDGIISQDPLGLDRIYMQAKRYAIDRVIDRPKIHEFAGALLWQTGRPRRLHHHKHVHSRSTRRG
jgi:restriction system protein